MTKRSRDAASIDLGNVLPGKFYLPFFSLRKEPTGIPDVGEAEGCWSSPKLQS